MGIFDDLLADIVAERDSRISIRRRGRPSKKQTARDEANRLVSVAEGFDGERARELATEALGLSPDCALAHVLLAELSDDADAAEEQYRQGIAAGERALGEAAIERHMGELGRVVEAAGYLRARRGLAECLTILGRPEEAIVECETLASLDAEDRIVARFGLLRSGSQHQPPGLQGPAQAGVVGRFTPRGHGAAQNRAGTTVHG